MRAAAPTTPNTEPSSAETVGVGRFMNGKIPTKATTRLGPISKKSAAESVSGSGRNALARYMAIPAKPARTPSRTWRSSSAVSGTEGACSSIIP